MLHSMGNFLDTGWSCVARLHDEDQISIHLREKAGRLDKSQLDHTWKNDFIYGRLIPKYPKMILHWRLYLQLMGAQWSAIFLTFSIRFTRELWTRTVWNLQISAFVSASARRWWRGGERWQWLFSPSLTFPRPSEPGRTNGHWGDFGKCHHIISYPSGGESFFWFRAGHLGFCGKYWNGD